MPDSAFSFSKYGTQKLRKERSSATDGHRWVCRCNGEALALFLYQHQVSVVNPRRIHHYASRRLVRTQNDQVDASLIADFCTSEKPRLWEPVAEDSRPLQDLVRARGFFINHHHVLPPQSQPRDWRHSPNPENLARVLERAVNAMKLRFFCLNNPSH